MLEKYECAPKLGHTDPLGGLRAGAPLARTARPSLATTDRYGCRNQHVQPAPELELNQPVEVVHLY
jgi:hypothetical protein